jgi:hypothetical protein
MATDKKVLRFKLSKESPGARRRTKKGRKRDTRERFWIRNGAESNA